MKMHSVSKCFQYIACQLEELFQMAGDAVRLLCLCGGCTTDTAGVQCCLHDARGDCSSQATPELL